MKSTKDCLIAKKENVLRLIECGIEGCSRFVDTEEFKIPESSNFVKDLERLLRLIMTNEDKTVFENLLATEKRANELIEGFVLEIQEKAQDTVKELYKLKEEVQV